MFDFSSAIGALSSLQKDLAAQSSVQLLEEIKPGQSLLKGMVSGNSDF
jgi:hypothetical protein